MMRQGALWWAGLIGMAVLAGMPVGAAPEKGKRMSAPEVAEHRSLTVVGVEFPDAGEKPYLIVIHDTTQALGDDYEMPIYEPIR